MSAMQRIAVVLWYEWRRALAKKWVIVLSILAIVFEALPFIALSQIPLSYLQREARENMWVVGVLSGQSLFVQLIAIQIAGSSMSEEYEQGTADVLLSKPITRAEYLAGKFFGGFLLLCLVETITTITGVVLSFVFFGIQQNIHFVPLIFAAIIYASLVFYSLTFMFSEVLRRSNLAMFAGFGVFLVSQIVGTYLLFLPGQFYKDISQLLPTWSATALPTSLAMDLNLLPNSWLISGLTFTNVGDVKLATAIIAVYTAIFVVLTYLRFARSDVTKKAA
ncbi:MAG: ABC transporter permease subunit [Candidatus Bathyarchaeia archaeon]